MSGSDRTEKPTQKRVRSARKEGRIARSQDFSAWVGLLVASVVVPYTVRHLTSTVTGLFAQMPALIARPDPDAALALLGTGLRGGLLAVAPLAGGILLAGIAVTAAQGGIHPSATLLKPKLSRLNPFAGLKKMLGPQGLWEGAKALLKTAVLAFVLWRSMRHTVETLVAAGQLPLSAVLGTVVHALLTLVRTAAVTGLVVAAADYAMVRYRLSRSLRMTKQEVKEEHKQAEGDPHVKSAIRSRQMAMSRNRMMADVAKADVVVVNPVHVAVALRYEPSRGAPRVVAKGAGAVAARIRDRAHEHRVPMVENIPLARALHRTCELGQEVPAELYNAVARVLAFVLSLKARGSGAGLHRPHITDDALKSAHLLPKRRRPGKARRPSGTPQSNVQARP